MFSYEVSSSPPQAASGMADRATEKLRMNLRRAFDWVMDGPLPKVKDGAS
jgi:hypothetical protein